jgi:hypothetical protein
MLCDGALNPVQDNGAAVRDDEGEPHGEEHGEAGRLEPGDGHRRPTDVEYALVADLSGDDIAK